MTFCWPGRRALHLCLIATLLAAQLVSTSAAAHAGAHTEAHTNSPDDAMIGTDRALAEARSTDQRERLLNALERDAVRDALVARGVNPDAAAERIDRLNDQELASLSAQMDELPAGAGATTLLLVIIILVLLLR